MNLFLQNKQLTKHCTFMFWKVYSSALLEKAQIFGEKSSFYIMTLCLHTHTAPSVKWFMLPLPQKTVLEHQSTYLIWPHVTILFPELKLFLEGSYFESHSDTW